MTSGQEMRAENLKMQIDAKKKITEEKIRNVLMDRYLHELYYQNGILKSANYLLDNIDNLKEISNRNLYKVKLHGDRSIDFAKTSEEAVKNAESSIDNIKENVRKELERNEREISILEGELAEARRILDHIIEHKTALGEGAFRLS